MNKYSNRRKFVKKSMLLSGGIVLSSNFISCTISTYDGVNPIMVTDFSNQNFDHGVASFDPTASQIIIWTRYSSEEISETIRWQLSTDLLFSNILREGDVVTDANRDYTISVEVQDLEPNQKLFYRFLNQKNKNISIVGETITLPSIDVTQIKLGITSCSNLSYGSFNVYNAMASSEIDIVVHLGDYIYENGPISSFDNLSPPNEIITLDDYRTRYRQYRTNTDLQLLHRKKPFICVWDDHEIANDSYKNGAANHQENEGDFETRKQDAIKAYSEYLPMLTNNANIIYRSFEIGNLVNLIMLDTRIIGRDKQLDFQDYINDSGLLNISDFQLSLQNPNRSMLGESQRNWLLDELDKSSSKWQLIGQQVLMGNLMIPVELLLSFQKLQENELVNNTNSEENVIVFLGQLTELVSLKKRIEFNDPTLTLLDIARVQTVVPFNLDSWDGYPAEREILLNAMKSKKVVVLTGDSHNSWQNDLISINKDFSGIELATPSVTSPGIEYLIKNKISEQNFEELFTELIDNLNYLNISDKGYIEIIINHSEINSSWVYVSSIQDENYQSEIKQTMTFI